MRGENPLMLAETRQIGNRIDNRKRMILLREKRRSHAQANPEEMIVRAAPAVNVKKSPPQKAGPKSLRVENTYSLGTAR